MYDMSKCSSLNALRVSCIFMHVTVHINALIFVAKLLCDVTIKSLFSVNNMYACLTWCNFVHVGPNGVYDMSRCSSWDALQDGCIFMHVRLHYDMFNHVAKVHVADKFLNLLWDDVLSCLCILIHVSYELGVNMSFAHWNVLYMIDLFSCHDKSWDDCNRLVNMPSWC